MDLPHRLVEAVLALDELAPSGAHRGSAIDSSVSSICSSGAAVWVTFGAGLWTAEAAAGASATGLIGSLGLSALLEAWVAAGVARGEAAAGFGRAATVGAFLADAAFFAVSLAGSFRAGAFLTTVCLAFAGFASRKNKWTDL